MGRASSGTALCTRAASAIRENTRKTRSGRNSNCLVLGFRFVGYVSRARAVLGLGLGHDPHGPPADQGRPGRGRRVRAQDGSVADAGPTPTPTWNYTWNPHAQTNRPD